jgi:hypothetical protein
VCAWFDSFAAMMVSLSGRLQHDRELLPIDMPAGITAGHCPGDSHVDDSRTEAGRRDREVIGGRIAKYKIPTASHNPACGAALSMPMASPGEAPELPAPETATVITSGIGQG